MVNVYSSNTLCDDIILGVLMYNCYSKNKKQLFKTCYTFFSLVLMQYNSYVQEGWTALHAACEKGHDDTVKILMRAKADLNLQSKVSNNSLLLSRSIGIWYFYVCIMYCLKY